MLPVAFVITVVLTLAAAAVAVPTLVLAIETIVAAWPGGTPEDPAGERPGVAVVIPAHDEGGTIGRTVEAVRGQLAEGDRLIVVADNCTDATATEARAAGAEVVERADAERRGKGYALAFGLGAVRADPRAVVIVLDADCDPGEGCIEVLARQAASTGRPAQAVYLMDPPADPTPGDRVSALAVRFKNLIRPRGLHRLGLGVLLTGSGMAFPIDTLEGVDLATGDLVEDMALGVELARLGRVPALCERAVVTSRLPGVNAARVSQRTRWEHGHLASIVRHGPRLVIDGVTRGKPALIGLGLEICVPPVSLLAIAVVAMAGVSLVWALFTWHVVPLAIAFESGVLLAVAFGVGWWRFGSAVLPAGELPAVVMYVVRKVPIYVRALLDREKTWVRTARD